MRPRHAPWRDAPAVELIEHHQGHSRASSPTTPSACAAMPGRGPLPARRERGRQVHAHEHPVGAVPARQPAASRSVDAMSASTRPGPGGELGIGMVYQHLSLIPTLIGAREPHARARTGASSWTRRARGRGSRSCPARSASSSTRTSRAGSLALGQQQQVEIIKALWKGSRVLILDEPTSMLTPQGIAELAEGPCRPEGDRAGDHLHHPQAPRGDRPSATGSSVLKAGPGRRVASNRRCCARPRRSSSSG